MRPRFGVTVGRTLQDFAPPKSAALLFDHIVVFGLDSILDKRNRRWWGPESRALRANVDWMLERGILLEERVSFEPGDLLDAVSRGDEGSTAETRHPAIVTNYLQQGRPIATYRWTVARDGQERASGALWLETAKRLTDSEDAHHAIQAYWVRQVPAILGAPSERIYLTCREVAGSFREQADGVAAVFGPPRQISSEFAPWGRHAYQKSSNALEVVLNALPQPTDDTPWEAILDFRADPETREKLVRLHSWLNKIGSEDTSPGEFADELAGMVTEYEAYMRSHRLAISRGVLMTIVVTAPEVAQRVLDLKWGEAAKTLFSIFDTKVELLKAERAAPHRDIAYIVAAHDEFGDPLDY